MKIRKQAGTTLGIGIIGMFLFASFVNIEEVPFEKDVITYFQNQQKATQEKLYLHLDKPYYVAGENIWFRAYLVNSITHTENMPDNFIYIELINQKDSIVFRSKIRKEKNVFKGNIALPVDLPSGEYCLRGYTNWMRNWDEDFFYTRNIQIGNFEEDSTKLNTTSSDADKKLEYDIQFFPEGGNLLTGVRQQIAFKCQKSNGFSLDIQGVLQNQAGDTITKFSTERDGMGSLSFYPEENEQYKITIWNSEGEVKSQDFPLKQVNGVGISLLQVRDSLIRYEVKASPSFEWTDTLYLLAHTRGIPVLCLPITQKSSGGIVLQENFSEGIAHFLVVNKEGIPLSERLLFVYPKDLSEWKIQSTPLKVAREKSTIQLNVQDVMQKAIDGSFSVSITDNNTVKLDSCADNIVSNLLLTSDLKGFIENPGYYFQHKDRKILRGLDLIMLTHGWRRFDIKNITESPEFIPKFYIEKGQFISGRILNFFRKGANQASVVAAAPQHDIVKTLETDPEGNFVLDGVEYKDSTTFVIQARTKKGLAMVDIEMDPETFPAIKNKNKFSNALAPLENDYLFLSKEKYYNEGGMRVYNLAEVTVKGTHGKESKENAARVWADYSITPAMLEHSSVKSAKELFKHAMGSGFNVEGCNPLVVIDGMCYWEDNYILETIYPEDIVTMDVYKDQGRCFYGSPGKSGPAVVLTLKPDAMARKHKGIILYKTLGYMPAAEFYHPKYETPEEKASKKTDIRTTVYWNPSLHICSDSTAVIEFYTPDVSSTYQIEIEGITKEGKICRHVRSL